MRIVLFDTETNGLPISFNALPTNVNNWPNILSIAWELWDILPDSVNKKDSQERYIKFNGTQWSDEAEGVHGITREYLEKHGEPGNIVCTDFIEVLKTVDMVVAHNISFDKSVFIAETFRYFPNMRVTWWPRLEYCTCNNTTELCKIQFSPPKKTAKYKKPKLIELYTYLFGSEKVSEYKFHTAADDVRCLTDCFIELIRRGHTTFKL